MDQPFSGFPDANWHDCGRRGASPAVPPPRGPLTKTGSTGTPRRHGAVAADTAAIFICRLREGLGSTRRTLTNPSHNHVAPVGELACRGVLPISAPLEALTAAGCERSDETPAAGGACPRSAR